MARLASRLGHEELAVRQTVRATELRQRFEEAFWCDAIGSYAMALHGNKRQCRVRSSNAGQCLYNRDRPRLSPHGLVFRRTASDVSMAITRRDSGIETVVKK